MKSWEFKLHVLLCGLVLQMGFMVCSAHDNTTIHPAVSESAANSSSALKSFLSDCFGITDFTKQPTLEFDEHRLWGAKGSKNPLEWIRAGSEYEDSPWIRGNTRHQRSVKVVAGQIRLRVFFIRSGHRLKPGFDEPHSNRSFLHRLNFGL